jgi:hypothetical protein
MKQFLAISIKMNSEKEDIEANMEPEDMEED